MKSRIGTWLEETHGAGFELFRHFSVRFFDNEIVTSSGEWAKVAAGAAGILISFWILLSRLLAAKYTALSLHAQRFHLNLASLCERECKADLNSLVLFAIGATILMAALLWWSQYPVRRDYLAVAGLPLRSSQVFFAKLSALMAVFCGFIVLLTLPAAIVFWAAMQSYSLRIPVGILTVVFTLAAPAMCVFALVLGVQGVMLNLLPFRLFERFSVYVQASLLIASLGAFSVAAQNRNQFNWLDAVPWATLLACALLVVSFALGYQRHRTLILETSVRSHRYRFDRLAGLWEMFVSDPREQAVLSFVWKTLTRSRLHRLFLPLYAGIAAACVFNQSSSSIFAAGPISLMVVAVLGLRYVFSLPLDLEANWIFQITERECRRLWLRAVGRLVVWLGLAPPILLGASLLTFSRGLSFAIAWILLASLFGGIVFEFLFRDWHKVPHACSYLPGRRPLIFSVALVLTWLFVLLPVVWIAMLAVIGRPLPFVVFFVIEAIVWVKLHRIRARNAERSRLHFEELPDQAVDVFGLSAEGTTFAPEEFRREWSEHPLGNTPSSTLRGPASGLLRCIRSWPNDH